jgi:hypothetical protein
LENPSTSKACSSFVTNEEQVTTNARTKSIISRTFRQYYLSEPCPARFLRVKLKPKSAVYNGFFKTQRSKVTRSRAIACIRRGLQSHCRLFL